MPPDAEPGGITSLSHSPVSLPCASFSPHVVCTSAGISAISGAVAPNAAARWPRMTTFSLTSAARTPELTGNPNGDANSSTVRGGSRFGFRVIPATRAHSHSSGEGAAKRSTVRESSPELTVICCGPCGPVTVPVSTARV